MQSSKVHISFTPCEQNPHRTRTTFSSEPNPTAHACHFGTPPPPLSACHAALWSMWKFILPVTWQQVERVPPEKTPVKKKGGKAKPKPSLLCGVLNEICFTPPRPPKHRGSNRPEDQIDILPLYVLSLCCSGKQTHGVVYMRVGRVAATDLLVVRYRTL